MAAGLSARIDFTIGGPARPWKKTAEIWQLQAFCLQRSRAH
jgi:hypothetical protein